MFVCLHINNFMLSYTYTVTEIASFENRHYSDGQYLCTRNILDCDQSNYSSRIILAHIPAKLLS